MVFILSSLWWERISLWKLPNGRDWLRVKLNLVLMGGAMLNKSLIQFSVDFLLLPCYLTWGQTVVEVMNIVVTSFKRYHVCTAACSAPNPAAGHHRPTPLLEAPDTHGQVWVSLLWGHCSFLLDPGVHKIHHGKCWAGWSTSWNQGCWEKYLRYTDDTTLMAESEELKSLLMKVKEESEKNWLKTQLS